MSNPSQEHFQAINHLWGYLLNTSKYCLSYTINQSSLINLTGYVDSDWGGDLIARKSTSGYIFFFTQEPCKENQIAQSAPIAWFSKLQKTPAISSCEAEYMAYKEAIKENLFINSFIKELHIFNKAINNSKIIYTDSQSAIALSKNPLYHARTKHIDIMYHFIRYHIVENNIDLLYIPTNKMIADGFTKILIGSKWQVFFRGLNLK